MSITKVAPGGFLVKWGIGRSIMQLDWGVVRERASSWVSGARSVVGTLALAGLAVALAGQAAGARREREAVARQGSAMDREIDRLRRSNQALREELRALDQDPVYVESQLRRWKMVGPSERVVE
jgi:cell division protein FtsB